MNLVYWLNSAWMWKCRRECMLFQRAAESVVASQAAVLREILANSAASEYGRAHDFGRIESPDQFRRCVPLADYGAFQCYVDRIGAGEQKLLTTEPVTLLEPTSGSSGGEKLIPYTANLRRQFQRGIDAWIANLMAAYPAARRGRAYWSISPAFGKARTTSGGIRIGFEDDTAYLGGVERLAMRRVLAVPPELAMSADIDEFRYQTLLHLLEADDLALISIWSPTFLTVLLEQLATVRSRLCEDLAGNPRADDLRRIIASDLPLTEKLRRLWPRLALISCWADGAASRYVEKLRALFSDVPIQPKGLLATEGFVSFPLAGLPGAALALRCHFFEFIDEHGEVRLAHEVACGQSYQVVVTTGGGLYRYRLGDIVEVVGFAKQCPLLRFVGRADRVSDLVGEKLDEAHVRDLLDRALADCAVFPSFSMLVPVDNGVRCYRLYLQGASLSAAQKHDLAARLEAGLSANPYYRHAVQLGQLARLEVELLTSSRDSAWSVYERECLARGQKLGDIKPTVIDGWTGWSEKFAPLTESAASKY